MTDLYGGVIGIDPSLVKTGLARAYGHIHSDAAVSAAHYGSTGKRPDPIARRAERIALVHDHVRHWLRMPERYLVVIEGPSYGSVSDSSWDRAGLWWRIVGTALAHEHDVVMVAPGTREKWATGKGGSGKKAVWATVPGADCDNCADATVLARMGAQAIGWYQGTSAQHAALTAVAWPELVAARILKPYETPVPHL